MPADGKIALETLSQAAFAPFGKLIRFSQNPADERFGVLIVEPESPWRVTMLHVAQRNAQRRDAHPSSMETFESVSGTGGFGGFHAQNARSGSRFPAGRAPMPIQGRIARGDYALRPGAVQNH